MAASHVALLRGINVGKAKRVAMADLRALVFGLGYADVGTLLNSGNVVFTAPKRIRGDHAARIEQAIVAQLGLTSRVTVLTAAELASIIAENPLGKVADDPSRLLVSVVKNPADLAKLKPLARQDWAPERLAIGTRASYLWCPRGSIESRLVLTTGKLLGDGTTIRNWATIGKLHALLADAG